MQVPAAPAVGATLANPILRLLYNFFGNRFLASEVAKNHSKITTIKLELQTASLCADTAYGILLASD